MYDALQQENCSKIRRGNQILIALRLIIAVILLAILLLQESRRLRESDNIGRYTSSFGLVTTLAFMPEGSVLLSGGGDAAIRFWNTANGEALDAVLQGQTDTICSLAVSPDGKWLAAGSMDRTVIVYEIANTAVKRKLSGLVGPATVLSWSPDSSKLLFGGGKNKLELYFLELDECLVQGPETTSALNFAAFLDLNRIVAAGDEGSIKILDSSTLDAIKSRDAHLMPITTGAISPDRKWLLTVGKVVRLWDIERLIPVESYEAHQLSVTAVIFYNNHQFITAGSDRLIKVWEIGSLKDVLTLGKMTSVVNALAVSKDGSQLAVGGNAQNIAIWGMPQATSLFDLPGHKNIVRTTYIPGGSGQTIPLYLRPEGLVLIVVLLLTLFYSLLLHKEELGTKLAYMQIFVDIGLIASLIYNTGGIESPFVVLYLMSIAAGAFVLSLNGAILAALSAAVSFGLIAALYSLGIVPQFYLVGTGISERPLTNGLNFTDYIRLLLLPIFAFFVIAYLAGSLASRLAVTRMLHQEVLEGIGEGILVLDLTRSVVYHNREVAKLLMQRDDLRMKSLLELLGEKAGELADNVLADGIARRIEIRHRRADSLTIPLSIRIIPVQDEQVSGLVRGLIVVLDDISAEQKMKEFYKHKERIEAMGQLSASIAHEIRNPLASIRGAVQEIARSVQLSDNKKVLFDIVLSESDRVDQIISDFLRFARLRPPNLHPVDVHQLLGDVRLLLASRPEADEVQIRLDLPAVLPQMLADQEQMRQVMINLGINALQALKGRPQKCITINAGTCRWSEAQSFGTVVSSEKEEREGILIEFQDTGCGIPEDRQREIFEPFFTTKAEGTGLGLAIIARIVQAHEGTVHVESVEGQGTTFGVWIPVDLKSSALDVTRLKSSPVLIGIQ